MSHKQFTAKPFDLNTIKDSMPEYLDEDDYNDEDIDDSERLATWGCSTLEERLERQRQEEVSQNYFCNAN